VEIQLQGAYTQQDFERAIKLSSGRTLLLTTLFFVGVLFLSSLLFGIAFLAVRADLRTVLEAMLPQLLLIVFVVGFMLATPRIQARRQSRSPIHQGAVTGAADDESLALESERSTARVRWTAFAQYKMSDEVIVLYQHAAAMTIIPRGLLASDEDWQRFCEHVQMIVPAKMVTQAPVLSWILTALILLFFAALFLVPALLTVLPLLSR
jgi:hypothetical protein